MPAVQTRVHLRIDQKALARELKSSKGSVGRTIAAFAGLVTREINETFTERAGGPWWRVKSTIFDGKAFGASATVVVRPSRAHVISARSAPALSFQFQDGKWFWGQSVRHPGSGVPEHLVNLGIERAIKKKEYKFFVRA